MLYRAATICSDFVGSKLSRTISHFCSCVQRLRRFAGSFNGSDESWVVAVAGTIISKIDDVSSRPRLENCRAAPVAHEALGYG